MIYLLSIPHQGSALELWFHCKTHKHFSCVFSNIRKSIFFLKCMPRKSFHFKKKWCFNQLLWLSWTNWVSERGSDDDQASSIFISFCNLAQHPKHGTNPPKCGAIRGNHLWCWTQSYCAIGTFNGPGTSTVIKTSIISVMYCTILEYSSRWRAFVRALFHI